MKPLRPSITTASRLSKPLLHTTSTNTTSTIYDVVEDKVGTFGHLLDQYPPLLKLRELHCRLFAAHLYHDAPLAVKLMRAYAARGCTSHVRRVFDQIPEKGVVLFNVMIRSYVTSGRYEEALLVFADMGRRGTVPDHYTFPCVLKACFGLERLWVGLQIHASLAKAGLCSNVFVGNALVFVYGRCKWVSEARRVFDEMVFKDVVSWNTMIACFAQNGCFGDALQVCKEMEMKNQAPDAATMASLLPAMTNTEPANVEMVRRMFDQMRCKGAVCWNAMIAIYANNGMASEAVSLFTKMEKLGAEPDAVTLASVLPACGDLSALTQGKKIHERIDKMKYGPNIFLENALVDMYAKCGCLEAARYVFDKMQTRDVVSWTSMISAYGMHGHGEEAVKLFSKMIESGLKPDAIAFVSILSACSHSGLLDKGLYYYDCMIEHYQIIPRIEHYACVVDLLGRAGQVDRAYDFIKLMPVEPNERVWGALLSACRVYSNMSIGLVAADQLFQLVPKESGYYVLMSNIYAKAGRWDEVTSVRKIMKIKGVKKLPGCSNVELNNRVYTFLVGDRSHPQTDMIYEKLEFLVGKMKEVGYVAETDSALHDVEEEDKEGHLAVHSEKLAIAFMLIHTLPGIPITITKNLRVCSDCHYAAKLISKITDRKIILRDTNRFHQFEGGTCSCGDYW